jgi:hypothetical protein
MRFFSFCAVLFGFVSLVLFGTGAAAWASPGDTNTTFDVTAGQLAISVPASAHIGSAAAGSATLSGQLGSVTVTDGRGALSAVWAATVSSTNFTTGTATSNETVSKANVSYSSGAASSTGTGAFTPSVAVSLAVPGTAGAWVGTAVNQSSWNPTLTMTLSPSQVAGTYSGTVTHSVL